MYDPNTDIYLSHTNLTLPTDEEKHIKKWNQLNPHNLIRN